MGNWYRFACLLALASMLAAGMGDGQEPPPIGPPRRGPTVRAGGGARQQGGAKPPDRTRADGAGKDPGAASPSVSGPADTSSVPGALATLAYIRPNDVVHTQAGAIWRPDEEGLPRASVWIACEFDQLVAARDTRWDEGANLAIELAGPDGAPVATARQSMDRDNRFALFQLPADGRLRAGTYVVRVTATPADSKEGKTAGLSVVVPDVPRDAALGQPVLLRRGPFSGVDWMPAGDLRYHRQERVKVETAVTGEMTSHAVRLLDRAGNPMPLPVIPGLRVESGVAFVSGEVALAPLVAGEYVLETTVTRGSATERRLVALRIVP